MSYRVGLTGGLAAGQSTVARWLAEAGFLVVDADRIVGELYRPGRKGARAVADLFGEEFLDSGGGVDRKRLADWVFADRAALSKLEAVIHPLVREEFQLLAESTSGIAVYEATLLVESGHHQAFDLVVTVEAPKTVRLQRAIERGMPEEMARSRLEAQGSGDARRAAADRVLDSSGSLEELRTQVDAMIADLRKELGTE